MDGADDPWLGSVDAGRAGSRHEEAGDRFLARIGREEQENGNQHHATGDEPDGKLRRERLQQGDLAPLAMLLLKLDCFLSEQRTV